MAGVGDGEGQEARRGEEPEAGTGRDRIVLQSLHERRQPRRHPDSTSLRPEMSTWTRSVLSEAPGSAATDRSSRPPAV